VSLAALGSPGRFSETDARSVYRPFLGATKTTLTIASPPLANRPSEQTSTRCLGFDAHFP
jgi:hypothetical protein